MINLTYNLKMEIFNPDRLKSVAQYSILQSGKGDDIDRYVYKNQQGEGLGSFFGNLLKNTVPFFGKAIKGAARIAKPHLIAAGKDIVTKGTKRGVEEINKKIVHKPHKKRRSKWQSL